ncbi:hypothetical protein ACFOOK_26310 [Micromonospora krabiensis]|uniref:hypothetical protein n=1 Tax=Micromonospora krabiensis TaxID=307121 RepID=UPI0012FDAF31|nr:hypothetical protein [Micromonospora krabiensis]
MTRYRKSRAGWAEIPEVCPAGHRDPDGNPLTTPAWGACPRCGAMGRQWRCQEPNCGRRVQHEHACSS